MASIRASRALFCAVAIASPWAAARKEIEANDSNPTAMTVSRISSESVTTKAKPCFLGLLAWGLMTVLGICMIGGQRRLRWIYGSFKRGGKL